MITIKMAKIVAEAAGLKIVRVNTEPTDLSVEYVYVEIETAHQLADLIINNCDEYHTATVVIDEVGKCYMLDWVLTDY